PCAAGIGQRRGCRDRVHGARIPLRGRTFLWKALLPPCAVAPFRVVAPCPAPQKPHTPPRSTAGFRIISIHAKKPQAAASAKRETTQNHKLSFIIARLPVYIVIFARFIGLRGDPFSP